MTARDDFLKYLAQTSREPLGVEMVRAEGCRVWDAAGREYLDFVSGISVANVGHRHPRILEAIRAQADRYLHVMVYGEAVLDIQAEFARTLCEVAPMPEAQAYLTTSGAEAVEGALKTARKHTARTKLFAFEMSYHGDTFGAMSVMGRKEMREPYEPLLPGVNFLPFGDEGALARIDRFAAAAIVEPIQAEGGVRVPPDGFLQALRARCDEAGALLIFDEVQTGLGRTGKLWAGTHWGVVPDILVLAKALGGGLPLGAFVGRRGVMKTLAENPPFSHLTTFGGHPLSCAAGLAALRVILGDDLAHQAAELGVIFRNTLDGLKAAGVVAEVRGKGLLLGAVMRDERTARAAVAAALKRGLLVGTAMHDERVLRLVPPLNIPDVDLVRGLELLAAALAEAAGRD